jgi:biotin operon repressor
MILTQAAKKEQHLERLALKQAESAFAHQITQGTNCSPFESQIIVEKAKEAFGVGQWADGRILADGQLVFHALAEEAPPGLALKDCPQKRIVLSLIRRAEDLEAWREGGAAAKRRQQILRLTLEAREQGALLTQEDLGLLLDSDVRTIRQDIKTLREAGLSVPTRGTVRDIGPGVTHKRRAVELWLSGKEPLEVARQLTHSLKAVERYIQTFCRVVYAQRQTRNPLQTALIVGISVAAVNDYFDLHDELIRKDPFYKERLDEILSVGEAHWTATDEKKSPGPRPKPRRAASAKPTQPPKQPAAARTGAPRGRSRR